MPPLLRREIVLYLDIFNDYLEFKILPWHKWGVDRGKFIPVRKTALKLLKNERSKQKWEQYERDQKAQQQKDPNSNPESNDDIRNESELGFAVRKQTEKELSREPTSRGIRIKSVTTNTAIFPIPSYEEAIHWDEKEDWKKYAAPLELDDYYNAHPDEKPDDWISPRDSLKSREEDDREVEEDTRKKREAELKALGYTEPPTS